MLLQVTKPENVSINTFWHVGPFAEQIHDDVNTITVILSPLGNLIPVLKDVTIEACYHPTGML